MLVRKFTCNCVKWKVEENKGWYLAYPDLAAVARIERKDGTETGLLLIECNVCPLCGKPTEEV